MKVNEFNYIEQILFLALISYYSWNSFCVTEFGKFWKNDSNDSKVVVSQINEFFKQNEEEYNLDLLAINNIKSVEHCLRLAEEDVLMQGKLKEDDFDSNYISIRVFDEIICSYQFHKTNVPFTVTEKFDMAALLMVLFRSQNKKLQCQAIMDLREKLQNSKNDNYFKCIYCGNKTDVLKSEWKNFPAEGDSYLCHIHGRVVAEKEMCARCGKQPNIIMIYNNMSYDDRLCDDCRRDDDVLETEV